MKEQKRYQASPLLKHISSLPDLASFFLYTPLTFGIRLVQSWKTYLQFPVVDLDRHLHTPWTQRCSAFSTNSRRWKGG